MRSVTYAGETIITTDDVAEALVELSAGLANERRIEAVRIPIVVVATGDVDEAEMVIGLGNSVISAPYAWGTEEPDFTADAAELREHPCYPRVATNPGIRVFPTDDPDSSWDPDLEGFDRA